MTNPNPRTPGENSATADPYAAAEEARQALSGMIFAALKMRGRTLHAAKASLPLTLITGFLGAGKTTLLNRLLRQPQGRRLTVLVNDFGRINIDAELVSSQTKDLISLKNGCACCAVAGDLTQALIDLAEREERPDAIVLEASGIADTSGVIQIALTNPSIRLEGVLVVVDAETLFELAEDPHAGRLFRNQIAAADLIALSKLDLLDDAKRKAVKEWFANPFAAKPVVEVHNGDLPADVVLGIGASHEAEKELHESSEHHAHDFESVSFTMDEPLDGDRLHTFLDSLPNSLWRAKGVLHLKEETARRTIYQRVGKRWSYAPAEPWGDEKPHSSLVFIGPPGSLDQPALKAGLDGCVAPEHPLTGVVGDQSGTESRTTGR